MGYAFDNQDNRYTFSWTYRDWVIGGLARCHDHPYEPVTTADYYALHGIFASSRVPEERPVIGEPPQGAESEAFQKKLSELMQGIADHESTELRRRKKLITEHFADAPGGPPRAMVLLDSPANPLTDRVIVNWVWTHPVGRGLIETPGDLGLRGEPAYRRDQGRGRAIDIRRAAAALRSAGPCGDPPLRERRP